MISMNYNEELPFGDEGEEDLNFIGDFFKEDSDEFNSAFLENSAITITQDGIAKDLKYFIEKKIAHNKDSLSNAARMVEAIVKHDAAEKKSAGECSGDPKKDALFELNKNNAVVKLLNHALKETKTTDTFLNMMIHLLLDKSFLLEEESLRNEDILDKEDQKSSS